MIFQVDITNQENPFRYSTTATRCLFLKGKFVVVEYISPYKLTPDDWHDLIANVIGETRESRVAGRYTNYRAAIWSWDRSERIKALSEGYQIYEANMVYEDNARKEYGIFTRRSIIDMVQYSGELSERLNAFKSFLNNESQYERPLIDRLSLEAERLASINFLNINTREIHASVEQLYKSIKTHIDGK